MTPLSKNARVAGLLYILSSLFGLVRLIYIPSTLLASGSAALMINSQDVNNGSECNGLISPIELIPGLNRLDFLVLGVPVIDHIGFFEIRHFNPS